MTRWSEIAVCKSASDVKLLSGLGVYWLYYFGDLHVPFTGIYVAQRELSLCT